MAVHHSTKKPDHTVLMIRLHRFSFSSAGLFAAALWLGVTALVSAAAAQGYECDRLRQEVVAAGRPDPQRTAQFARAAERQRAELSRTQAYADQIGCTRGFSIFGNDGPAQCDGIQAHIERMNNNLSALEQQIDQVQGGGPGRQAALAEQYRASCSTQDAEGIGDDPMWPGLDGQDTEQPSEAPRRGGKAICVRTCDGGFFPLNFSGSQRDSAGLQSLCTALCPNTDVKLYTTPDTDNIDAAVSIDGAAYTDLPAAFKFQKSFDATCTCKPPNKSWVEALNDAEHLLDKGRAGDVTVTAKMSDDMARPVAATPAPTKKKPGKTDRKAILQAQSDAEGALGAVAQQAPTASRDSAGIADAGPTDHTVKTGEGEVKTLPGPDGAKRRVRIVGPTL